MTTNQWSDVDAANQARQAAYQEMLANRAKHRSGSRKVRQSEDRWVRACAVLSDALLARWDETEDGVYADGKPRLYPVLHRYYAATIKPKRKGKR